MDLGLQKLHSYHKWEIALESGDNVFYSGFIFFLYWAQIRDTKLHSKFGPRTNNNISTALILQLKIGCKNKCFFEYRGIGAIVFWRRFQTFLVVLYSTTSYKMVDILVQYIIAIQGGLKGNFEKYVN